MVRTFLKVYMELGSYFLFLQEQIKDIIIVARNSVLRVRDFLRRQTRKKRQREIKDIIITIIANCMRSEAAHTLFNVRSFSGRAAVG